jgi:sortase A
VRSGIRRRFARHAATLMIVAGGLLLADVAVTLVWQEPATGVIGLIREHQIDRRYLRFQNVPLTAVDRRTLVALPSVEERIAYAASHEAAVVPEGAAIGVLSIPSIDVDFEVVQGTDTGDLERGPGHYASTAFPGEGETVAVAGHRTTYLAPFRNINRLRPGQRIVLRTSYATFVYAVQRAQVVTPTAWWITDNVGYERLVLSACNPIYSASQRLVVFARLRSETPVSGALTSVS